jgi:hypothetical protein
MLFAGGSVVWFQHFYGFEHNPLFSVPVVEYESCTAAPPDFERVKFGLLFPSTRYFSVKSGHGAVTLLNGWRNIPKSIDGQSFYALAAIAPYAEVKLGVSVNSRKFNDIQRSPIALTCLESNDLEFTDMRWVRLKRSREPATWTIEIDLPRGVTLLLPRSQVGLAGRSVSAKLSARGINWSSYTYRLDQLSDPELNFGPVASLSRYGDYIYRGVIERESPVVLTLRFDPEAADALGELDFIPLLYFDD